MKKWNDVPGQVLCRAPTATDSAPSYGYGAAQTLVKVLKKCGDNLTRENVMKQAASLKDLAPGHAAAGRQDQHRATDFAPIEPVADACGFKGEKWEPFGDDHQR